MPLCRFLSFWNLSVIVGFSRPDKPVFEVTLVRALVLTLLTLSFSLTLGPRLALLAIARTCVLHRT